MCEQASKQMLQDGSSGDGLKWSGLNARNFRKVAPNGFGDPFNCYPHSMYWFNDYLYVGTTRANLANRAKQVAKTAPERMGEIWPVRVPHDYFDNDLSAEIWRYHPPTGAWEEVYKAPTAIGIDGYEVPISVGFRCMISFQGASDSAPALYVPTWATHQTPACLMLRSADGRTFEVVSEPGLGLPDPKPRSLRGFVSFNGYLFTSPVVGQSRLEPNIAGLMAIYASADPAVGNWKLAFEPEFGNNLSVFHMEIFNGFLYAGTLNVHEGFEIWKTDAQGEPPFAWKKVISNGAYRGKLNQVGMTLRAFGDHLYVGSAIQNCSFDHTNKIGPAAPEIIRINADDSWEVIVGEPRLTPEGLKVPLSGIGPGFGNPFAGYLWSMCVHDGWLYAATAVWAVFLRYVGGERRMPKGLRAALSRDNIEKMLHRSGGCDLWRTRDGIHWIPVTHNGFQNEFNIGIRNMVSTPFGLFAGTANPFSPEVAVRRVCGWTYEKNERGGLEIWLGSATHHSGRQAEIPEENSLPVAQQKTLDDDEDPVENVMNDMFSNTDFRHFGFWRFGMNNAFKACETLMDEMLAFITTKQGSIVDIGCGLGASTRYLLKHYPPESVTGVTFSRDAITGCSRNAVDVRFVVSRLPRINLPSGTFDTAIWMTGFAPLGDRQTLFNETVRILKPGGQLVCFDLLSRSPEKKQFLQKNTDWQDSVGTIEEYRALFLSAGFEEPRIVDVTVESLRGFCAYAGRFMLIRRLAGEYSPELLDEVEKRLMIVENIVSCCVLASAFKPLAK